MDIITILQVKAKFSNSAKKSGTNLAVSGQKPNFTIFSGDRRQTSIKSSHRPFSFMSKADFEG